MSNERFASVWDAIEDTPEEAENMKLRSALMMALKKRIETAAPSQSQAAKVFGVTQPRVSTSSRTNRRKKAGAVIISLRRLFVVKNGKAGR